MTCESDAAREALGNAAAHLVPGIAERHRVIGSGAVEARAEGAVVELSNGRQVLDFGSYAVPLFGHRPGPVVEAVHRALDEMPTSTRLLANPYASALAARLAALVAPDRLPRVWLGLSGADAVEAVLKLAIAGTGRSSVLAVEGGFHGKSMGALAATFAPEGRKPVQDFLGRVRHIPREPDAVARAADEESFAALIVEPVQGEGGGHALEPELLRRWSRDAHAAGMRVVADEIQCGLRRCGPLSVAVEAGMEPDAVLFGKALGGGVMPLSAAVCSEELFTPLLEDPFFHTSTFGGHPLSCAAGLAALDLLEEMAGAFAAPSTALAAGLAGLAEAFPGVVTASRCHGLLGAVEFGSAAQAGLAVLESGRRGTLLAQCLTAPNVLRLLPPAVATPEQLETAVATLRASCRAVGRRTLG